MGFHFAPAAVRVAHSMSGTLTSPQAHVAYGGLGVVLGALDALPYHVGVQVAGMELLAELVEGGQGCCQSHAYHRGVRPRLQKRRE